MKNIRSFVVISFAFFTVLFAGNLASGQTFTTITNGNWSAPTTWAGGVAPDTAGDILNGTVINICHTVAYDTGNNVKLFGEIRIQKITGTQAILNVPTAITFEVFATGRFIVIDGSYRQCRFANCNDGQPYSGNTPTGGGFQSGNLKNIGGYNEGRNCQVEIAQDWTNESGGTRLLEGCCVKTGQNFSLAGVGTNDNLIRTFISVGWHGSGSYEVAVGTAASDIDQIALRNNIVPFTGSGEIFGSTSVVGTTNLDAYCVITPSQYIPNGRYTGPQVPNSCVVDVTCVPPSAAAVEISGRVFDDRGRGVPRARVSLTHPNGNVSRALTNAFGYYRFTEVESGATYVIQVGSKRFVYDSRAINVVDNISDLDFVPRP